jgi:Protein of unknown function DUF58
VSHGSGGFSIVRPTSAGTVTLLLSTGLVLIGLRASNPWLLLVGSALFAPVLISQLLRPKLGSIAICVRSPDRVAVGHSVEQVFQAHNRGRRSTPGFRLTDLLEGFAAFSLVVPSLPPGGRAELAVRRTALSRVLSESHELQLRTTAPFGMALYRRRIQATVRISVHPAPGPIAQLSGAARLGDAGGRPARSGHDLHGLREWRRGDPFGQVHWRATARHGRLTVVIPEIPVQSRFALLLAGFTQDEHWEALLSTAAWSAVENVRRGGGLVRLSAAGVPDYIGADPALILDWFAELGLVPEPPGPLLLEAVDWAGQDGLVVAASTRPLTSVLPMVEGVVVLDPGGRVLPL